MQPGGDATPCSCTVTAREGSRCLYIEENKQPFYGGRCLVLNDLFALVDECLVMECGSKTSVLPIKDL